MKRKARVLIIGDGVTPTGFSTVNHNIIKNLDKDKYEIHHLAVNYFGDPHTYDHFIYPAALPNQIVKGDMLGYGRIQSFMEKDIDLVYILNDIWVIDKYLETIKRALANLKKKEPKIIVYYPVDGAGYSGIDILILYLG